MGRRRVRREVQHEPAGHGEVVAPLAVVVEGGPDQPVVGESVELEAHQLVRIGVVDEAFPSPDHHPVLGHRRAQAAGDEDGRHIELALAPAWVVAPLAVDEHRPQRQEPPATAVVEPCCAGGQLGHGEQTPAQGIVDRPGQAAARQVGDAVDEGGGDAGQGDEPVLDEVLEGQPGRNDDGPRRPGGAASRRASPPRCARAAARPGPTGRPPYDARPSSPARRPGRRPAPPEPETVGHRRWRTPTANQQPLASPAPRSYPRQGQAGGQRLRERDQPVLMTGEPGKRRVDPHGHPSWRRGATSNLGCRSTPRTISG